LADKKQKETERSIEEIVRTPEGYAVMNRLLAEKSLLDFVRQAWAIIEPGVSFKENWHLEYLEEELLLLAIEDVWDKIGIPEEQARYLAEYELNNRVNINIPPRTMKSLFINVFFPCWLWIHNPSKKIITVSYSNDLSIDLNKKRREIIQSQWYQDNWGHIIKLKEEQNTKTYFENTKQGTMFATSIGGTLTGKGGDIVFLDDIQNPRQAESEADRLNAIRFVTNTLPTRLNDFVKGSIVNIQQRLHFNDVSGYLQENYDFYKTIILPVETEKDRYYTGPISGKIYHYPSESVLWPNRMPPSWIAKIKKEQGARTYNAQFLQDPTPPGGNLIDVDSLRTWKTLPIYNKEIMEKREDKFKLVQSWDMNFKKKAGADNVACSVFLTDNVTSYLVDMYEKQIGFVETLDAVVSKKEEWEDILYELDVNIPIEVVIEDAANGPAIMEVLEIKVPGMIPITSKEDKFSRMSSITTFLEAGNVLVPDTSTSESLSKYQWWEDKKEELAKFPNVTHDDFSDSFSAGLRRIYVNPPRKRKRMRIF